MDLEERRRRDREYKRKLSLDPEYRRRRREAEKSRQRRLKEMGLARKRLLTPEQKAKYREYQKQWKVSRRASDPDGYKASVARDMREWRKKYPDKARLSYLRCRLRRRGMRRLTDEEIVWVLSRLGGECAYCATRPEKLEIDHLIAVSVGGESDLGNLVPCCRTCNASKGSRPWRTWFRAKAFYSREREDTVDALPHRIEITAGRSGAKVRVL